MTLYLKNPTFIDWKSFEIIKKDIKVTEGYNGAIQFIEKAPEQNKLAPEDKIIDCAGKIVTKSFGCGHHHIYSTLARGMGAPKKIPANFKEILKYIWWHLDKCLNLEMIEASALACAIFCAKNGVTFVIDHHASPFAVKDSLFTIADAFDKVGVSSLLCYELSDRDGEKSKQQGLEEHQNYLNSGKQGHIGLHASFTIGDTLLKQAILLAEKFNTGIHIHVAEDKADQEDCLKDYGIRVVERLYNFGALNLPKTILSHCIHLNQNEKKLIKDSGVWVAENIESNQNNNVGLADYSAVTNNVMLGTDGMHSDMLRSAKAAFFAGQSIENVGMDTIYARFRNIHHYIEKSGFKGDGENNLLILDYNSPTEVTADNFLGHFIFGIDSSHIQSVIANGKLIIENKQTILVNEDDILIYARQMGLKLWDKMK
ncbi:MAG: amidohydrolase family protein [Deltaproteobacteria bacterium]|nr:amidohydrolase family protein [Deltaproteobacteria bacterium]